ncbi:MAG: hypothetical protein AAF352_03325, partial [Pseudomonadota bacterium]
PHRVAQISIEEETAENRAEVSKKSSQQHWRRRAAVSIVIYAQHAHHMLNNASTFKCRRHCTRERVQSHALLQGKSLTATVKNMFRLDVAGTLTGYVS